MPIMHGHLVPVEQVNEIIITDVVVININAHITLSDFVNILLADELVLNFEAVSVLKGQV